MIHRFEVVIRNASDGILGVGQPREPLKETWLLDFDLLHSGGVEQVIFAIERLDAFPHGSPLRKDLAASMSRIRRFRNRVAHHDRLLGQDVVGLTEEMLRIIGWIDSNAEAWVRARARVFDLLEQRPEVGVPQACSAAGARAAMPSR